MTSFLSKLYSTYGQFSSLMISFLEQFIIVIRLFIYFMFIFSILSHYRASLVPQLVKNPPAMQETWIRSLHWQYPLEKGMATHSSNLAWRIVYMIKSCT